MIREGFGKISPTPVDLRIEPQAFRHYERVAKAREDGHRYAHSSRVWQRGLIDRPTLTGLVAEWGFATWANLNFNLSLQPDEAFRKGGDSGIDFSVFGITIQVKGRRRSGDLLVRRETEDGRLLSLPWQICVVVTYEDAGCAAEVPNLWMTIDGWVSKNTLRNDGTFANARKGTHKNLEIPDEDLEQMTDLATFLESRRAV